MMIRMALDLLIILVPLQMFLGDQHGLNTLEHQPAKIAAIEGRYDTVKPMPLTLFGIPDDAAATMRYAIEIPISAVLFLPIPGTVRSGASRNGRRISGRPSGRRFSPSASWWELD